jgi:hypothetical protein
VSFVEARRGDGRTFSLKLSAFEDKQGIKCYVTEIISEQVLMLDKKES